MREEDFEELLQGVRELKAYDRGELNGARVYTADSVLGKERALLIEARQKTGLSQAKFAQVLSVSPRTLQDWEQGRREPSGAARTLIHVAARYPEAVLTVARPSTGKPQGERVNGVTTSRGDAKTASKLLRSKKSSAAIRSVAGSDLVQAKRQKSGKRKTKR